MLQEIFIAAFKVGLPIALASFALVRWALGNHYLGDAKSLEDMEKKIKRLSKQQQKEKKKNKARNKQAAKAPSRHGKPAAERAPEIRPLEPGDFGDAVIHDAFNDASEDFEKSLSLAELLHPGGRPNRKLNPVLNKWLSFGGGFYGLVGLMTYAVVELGEIVDFLRGFESIAGFFQNIGIDMLIRLFIEGLMNFIVAIAWPIYWLDMISGQYIWVWFLVAYGGYWLGARLALRLHGGQDTQSP